MTPWALYKRCMNVCVTIWYICQGILSLQISLWDILHSTLLPLPLQVENSRH